MLAHGFTYGGHPVAAAVALKTIEIYQQRDMVGHVRHVEPVFLERLASLEDHPLVGEAKGVGLIARRRTGGRQSQQSNPSIPAKGVAQKLAGFAEERGPDRAAAAVRPFRAVPAAGDQRGGDRRIVRPPGTRPGQDAGLGETRKADLARLRAASARAWRAASKAGHRSASRRSTLPAFWRWAASWHAPEPWRGCHRRNRRRICRSGRLRVSR